MFLILAKLKISRTYVFASDTISEVHISASVAYKSVKMHLTFIVCRSTMQGTEFISSWIWFSPGFGPGSDLALAATAHESGGSSDLPAAAILRQQRLGGSSDLAAAAVWRQHGFSGSTDLAAARIWRQQRLGGRGIWMRRGFSDSRLEAAGIGSSSNLAGHFTAVLRQ